MSRRSVTRAVCAPLAIALVTTAIPPAISNHIAINLWTTHKLTAMLASTEVGVGWLGENLNQRAEESAGKVIQVREELAAQLSATADTVASGMDATYTRAADAISSSTDAALARIDSWMTSASQTVIAMLPSGSNEPAPVTVASVETSAPTIDELRQTASLSTVSVVPSVSLPAEIEVAPTVAPTPVELVPANEPAPVPSVAAEPEPPAPQVARQAPVQEVEQTNVRIPATEAAHATFDPVEAVTAMLAPPAHAAVPAEIKIEAKPAVVETAALPVATPAPETIPQAEPVIEAKVAEEELSVALEAEAVIEPIRVVESKPQKIKAAEKMVVASLDRQVVADTQPVATPAPAAVELKTQETKTEEKLVVASLGHHASAVDVAAPEFKAVPESSSSESDTPSNSHVIDPLQMTNVPMSAPLKIRALTRADIPAAEKLASLGSPSTSDARKLAPEEQRVAYDAPAEAETPISIGRRRWTEEAAKYQGLGSPEALLEALKHMGAGAKSLGLPASLWCADFMNLVLRKSGIPATGSRAAKSYLQYGQKINEPRVGAIAIFSRGSNGGHIGIVRGTDGKGNPIIVSGNHNHKVAEAIYPKERVLAYVVPR